MPIHEWGRVDAGLFHAFHHGWIEELARALNQGVLPGDYFALPEQNIRGPIPDVLTLQRRPKHQGTTETGGGLAVATAPPRARFVHEVEENTYARRANRIRIQHRHGQVVAVVEIVSPGNKDSEHALRAFVRKASDLIWQGIHLLVVDLFPPSARDPQGIHKAIWDEIEEEPFELPPDKRLTLAAYVAGDLSAGLETIAYVEPVGVGDVLPDMPAYLDRDGYVPVPLEATYQLAWGTCPPDFRELVETGKLPGE